MVRRSKSALAAPLRRKPDFDDLCIAFLDATQTGVHPRFVDTVLIAPEPFQRDWQVRTTVTAVDFPGTVEDKRISVQTCVQNAGG